MEAKFFDSGCAKFEPPRGSFPIQSVLLTAPPIPLKRVIDWIRGQVGVVCFLHDQHSVHTQAVQQGNRFDPVVLSASAKVAAGDRVAARDNARALMIRDLQASAALL